ncbi:MAG TPA: vWA domain-containing protein [Polyangiaceae bacterium]|nr:vWA domain-containing protein [Polyangiaceae bacterium]
MAHGKHFGALICALSLFGLVPSCGSSDSNHAAGPVGKDGGAGADAGSGGAGSGGDRPDGASGAGGAPDGGALDLFTAWERAQTAMRKSPDHLPAKAAALVAAKDATKLFEFVRDEISTYPPSDDGFYGAVDQLRFGARGTLRGGAGSPRDKAELLKSLYEQAGFTAEVVHGTVDPAKLDGKKMLFRPITRSYAPAMTKAEGDEIRAALGHDAPPTLTAVDSDGSQAEALATNLLGLLPSTLASTPFDFTVTDVPLVAVTVSGEKKYANPLAPGAAFGDSATTDDPLPAGAPSDPPQVTVKLEAARSSAPFDRFTLVEHQYATEDVIGRRIHVAFTPPVGTESLIGLDPKSVEAVVPVVTVGAPDLTQADKDRLAVVGKPVSFGGNVYDLDLSGNPTIDGNPIPPANTDPNAAKAVTTVDASANGAAFPRVTVRVKATDAGGVGVPHLDASTIVVKEDGKPVSFTLTQTEAPPPRVVLLFDASTSVPAAFRGAGAVTVGDQIVTGLYSKYPNAAVRVGVIDFGVIWASTGWATTETDATTQVATLSTATGSSEIWQAVHDADVENPTLIVLVTDGDATDTPEAKFTDGIATGAPVLSIGVGTVVQATLDQLSTLSGGRSAGVTQQGDAVNAILGEVDARAVQDYVLSYRAPPTGNASRSVTVTINGQTATTTYDVPQAPATEPALSGVYLTVGVGSRQMTRAIAGFESGYTTAGAVITPEILADVRSLLFGRVSIAVEGASPPPSVVMDDWIAEKLSLRPLWEAATAHDDAKTLAALKAGFSITPPKLPLSQPPLRDAIRTDSLTFEAGPRIATMLYKGHEGGALTRSLDLFPLTRFVTAAEDPRTAFTRTLTATAGLAVAEAGMYQGTSTLESLQGKTLTAMDAGQAENQAGLTPEEALRWAALEEPFNADYQVVGPAKPGPFWAVDETSGTVMGILPDGSGGAVEDACSAYDQANNFLQLASLLGSLTGEAVGGWVAIAQWEVKYLTIATIVISGGTPAGGTDLSNPAVDMGCGMFDDALGDAVPGLGLYEQIVGTAETSGGVDTGLPTVCGGGDSPCP